MIHRYPEMVLVYPIGKSVNGNFLWVTRISTEVPESKNKKQRRKLLKPMVKIVANMHGNEVFPGLPFCTTIIPQAFLCKRATFIVGSGT